MHLPDVYAVGTDSPLTDLTAARETLAFLAAGFEIAPAAHDAAADHLDHIEAAIRRRNACL